MICPVCGNIAEDNAKFCGNCGTNFSNIQSAPKTNIEEDAVASFLSEMEENSAQSIVSENITEQTDAVYQETQDRLFLDDDDEEEAMSDEAIVNKFFDNLDSLEEDAPMDLSSEYKPEETQSKKIAPVFEEIPDEPIELPAEESEETNNANTESFDDYSDIVMGDDKPAFVPVPEIPAQEPVQEQPIIEKSTVEESVAPITEQTVLQEQPIPETLENIDDNEPHILIDERPDNEQNVEEFSAISEYNVNPVTDGQTPYLDSFLQKPNFNVGFDAPNMDNVPQQNFVPNLQETQVQNTNFALEQSHAIPVVPVAPIQQPSTEQIQNTTGILPTQSMPNQQPQMPISESPTIKPPKKKKTGLIIGLCVIGVLLIGIVVSAFLLKDTISSLFNPDIQIETPIEDNREENKDNNDKNDSGNQFIPGGEETGDNGDEGTTDETTDNNETTEPPVTEPTTPVNKPDWELKETSSLENPLIVGDATSINRYIDDIKVYETLNLKLSKIYRGEESLNIAKQYEDGSTVRFEKPQEGIEYVVIEYEIYVPMESKTTGTLTNLPIEIRGLTTNGVIHNNKSYIISTWCVNDGGTAGADMVVKCQEIFQMPVGCTDYYIVFGTQGQNPATYKGE